MNKLMLKIIVVVILVGTSAFYGGMKYGQANNSVSNMKNLSAEQRQQFRSGADSNIVGAGRRVGIPNGGEFINGDIISKDDKSITVKLRDGGSKIIFFSSTTSIGKTTQGEAADLEVGKQVSINGSTNSDGSVTAQNIQIRPSQPVNK